jgi:hypothetical protein
MQKTITQNASKEKKTRLTKPTKRLLESADRSYVVYVAKLDKQLLVNEVYVSNKFSSFYAAWRLDAASMK